MTVFQLSAFIVFFVVKSVEKNYICIVKDFIQHGKR